MSAGNGEAHEPEICIEERGFTKVQVGDYPAFEIDVVDVYNQFVELDRTFRDEKGTVRPEMTVERNRSHYEFVWELVKPPDFPEGEKRRLSQASAIAFLNRIADKQKELQDFFAPASDAAPSSPESMGNLVYSSEE